MRLAEATRALLAPGVAQPEYDRAAQAVGIVHFGIGAFHRAHQAWYTDAAMNIGDRNWAITGVSLRSASVAEQLDPQDGLYTLVERSAAQPSARLIGAVRGVVVASKNPDAVIAALASPTIHIASFTVTEKDYCRAPAGSLDPAQAGEGHTDWEWLEAVAEVLEHSVLTTLRRRSCLPDRRPSGGGPKAQEYAGAKSACVSLVAKFQTETLPTFAISSNRA